MKENFLHFIWKLQLFSYKDLVTVHKDRLQIMNSGLLNENQGPDFLNAKIEIDEQIWFGNIEIHLKSSDWYVHSHEEDSNYDSVILHVVWEHDVEVFRSNSQVIQTLELKKYIDNEIILKYQRLFLARRNWIFCENDISKTPSFILNHWKERLFFERLEQKSAFIKQFLKANNNDWESTLFMLLFKNFGLKINGEAFLSLASTIKFSLVRKLANNRTQLEALFFGQAGLLFDDFESSYFLELKKEYEFLKRKFNLQELNKGQVQFFRLRPSNFPTIRLSQIASLYHKNPQLFSNIMEAKNSEEIYKLFTVSTSGYWKNHFTFNKESRKTTKYITKSFIDLLIINTIIPLKFMYLKSQGTSDYCDVLSLIETLKPEKNSIISEFNKLKINSENAFESQALLQLKNNYCNKQRCLDCEIGTTLLKN